MIIGITGGTGSGKTTLLSAAQELGILVLDCDAIYHTLLSRDEAMLTAIEDRFPGTVEQGRLQRKKLGALVFSDAAALEDLNKITHTAITREVKARLRERTCPHAAIDAIALFESGMDGMCDVTVAVTAPREIRVQRLMARENISEAYACQRIAAQPEDGFFVKKCDYVLENDGDIRDFQEECLAFFAQLGIMDENPERRNTNDQ